ncbi:hypothetical protein E2C01_015874 [Portunus trituberculatus]|uniref:Uncharacterized protein n=1 Tax=Portunus trituberculatus TaxID=210409 RepID=A0A5B7DN25_PORTR|nr:hypothetical protein [Portunus trituberculatus]
MQTVELGDLEVCRDDRERVRGSGRGENTKVVGQPRREVAKCGNSIWGKKNVAGADKPVPCEIAR